MNLTDLISLKWKAGTWIFGATTLGLGVACFLLNAQNGNLSDSLTATRADLTTAKNNATVLEATLAGQNKALADLQTESQRRLDAATKAVDAAQQQRRKAEQQSAILLSRPIPGTTLEERIRAVDAMVLESLK